MPFGDVVGGGGEEIFAVGVEFSLVGDVEGFEGICGDAVEAGGFP